MYFLNNPLVVLLNTKSTIDFLNWAAEIVSVISKLFFRQTLELYAWETVFLPFEPYKEIA